MSKIPFVTNTIFRGYDTSKEDDVLQVELEEDSGSSYRPGSNFYLKFKTITASNKVTTISIPLNKKMAHFIAMMLSENLEYIYENDSLDNSTDDNGTFIYASKNEKYVNVTQQSEDFRNLFKNLKMLK